MSKYESGLYKGQEIMTEYDKDRRWCDVFNNVVVEREHDGSWTYLETFCVSERLRGNTHTVWAKGMSFEDAVDLAERLMIGKDYLPPKR